MVTSSETGVVATKVYKPSSKNIQVHQSRVTRCPVGFPPGYFWYGTNRAGPGRPPKWVDQLVRDHTSLDASDDEPQQEANGEYRSDEELREIGPEPNEEHRSNDEIEPEPNEEHRSIDDRGDRTRT